MARISAILTAAGESTRMGRPKPLLSWCGVTLVEYQISSLLEAGVCQIVVVLGHAADEVAPRVGGPDVEWVLNEDYLCGRTTSITTGLRAVAPDCDGVLILGVDQPRTPSIIEAVLRSHAKAKAIMTSPRHRGRGGHPIAFSSAMLEELAGISEEKQGIRALFRRHRTEVNEVEIDDPMVLVDLNTPEDFQRACVLFGGPA